MGFAHLALLNRGSEVSSIWHTFKLQLIGLTVAHFCVLPIQKVPYLLWCTLGVTVLRLLDRVCVHCVGAFYSSAAASFTQPEVGKRFFCRAIAVCALLSLKV